MSYATKSAAWDALRNLLNDNPNDKLCDRKKIFGQQDGSNTLFKTFEFRRVTDFTSAESPFGVFAGDSQVGVSDDNMEVGAFNLSSPPEVTDKMTATYYYQWFLDEELDKALILAASWINSSTNYLSIDNGLDPALLDYAAFQLMRKLANKCIVRASTTFQLEEAPKKEAIEQAKQMQDMANAFSKSANDLRKQFYSRQDQALAPLFGTAQGRAGDITPRR